MSSLKVKRQWIFAAFLQFLHWYCLTISIFYLPGHFLAEGVFVQGGFGRGGFCPGGFVQGGLCPRGVLSKVVYVLGEFWRGGFWKGGGVGRVFFWKPSYAYALLPLHTFIKVSFLMPWSPALFTIFRQIMNWLQKMQDKHSDKLTLFTVGTTVQGQPMHAVKVSNTIFLVSS